MTKNKIITLVILVAAIVGVIVSYRQQSVKIVDFCGVEYTYEPIVFSGVDIIQRIAELGEKFPDTCSEINKYRTGEKLLVELKPEPIADGFFTLLLNGKVFTINTKNKMISRAEQDGINPFGGFTD